MFNKFRIGLAPLLLLAAAAPAPIAPSNLPQISSLAELQWPSATGTTISNGTYDLILATPWAAATINSVSYQTGGSSTPTFTLAIQINGVAVTGCSAIVITGAATATTACTAANILSPGSHVTAVITAASGTIIDPRVQLNIQHTVQ